MKSHRSTPKNSILRLALKLLWTLALIILFSFYTYSGFPEENSSITYSEETSNAGFCCESRYENSQFDTIPLEQLGLEFQRLKALNCQYCQHYGSDLQIIMEKLGERLSGKSKRDIKNIMGKPGDKKNNCFIYHWRESHDFLIFDFSGGNGAVSEWYYAHE